MAAAGRVEGAPGPDGGDSVFLQAAATGGRSEFPTGNELQLQAESGLRVWASQGSSVDLRTTLAGGTLGLLGAGCGVGTSSSLGSHLESVTFWRDPFLPRLCSPLG